MKPSRRRTTSNASRSPSAAEFRSKYLRAGRPVVFRGLAAKWHRSAHARRLAKRYGHRRVAVTVTRHGRVDVDLHSGVPTAG